jgi:hypothetical protein
MDFEASSKYDIWMEIDPSRYPSLYDSGSTHQMLVVERKCVCIVICHGVKDHPARLERKTYVCTKSDVDSRLFQAAHTLTTNRSEADEVNIHHNITHRGSIRFNTVYVVLHAHLHQPVKLKA